MVLDTHIKDMTTIENTKGVSNFVGSFLVLVGLIWFVLGYKYYSIDYLSLMKQGKFSIDIFTELGEHLTAFIQQASIYVWERGKVDFTLYTTFYTFFWSWKYTLIIFIGTYLKVSGSPILRVKKIVAFGIVFLLVLLIEIPVR